MIDVSIIGAGPAGLTAAIYAARAGLSVKIFESTTYGGQLNNTAEVDNYPATPKISGWQLAKNIYDQVLQQDVSIVLEKVESIEVNEKHKVIITNSNQYRTKTIIIANGAKRRKLDVPGEKEFTGKGISYCATCDGNFFKNKTVAVVGGGNTALEDTLFLSNLCQRVYIIHRRNTFRGEKFLVDAVKSKSNISILFSHIIQKIIGKEIVTCIETLDLKTGHSKEIKVDGVFIAVGMQPDNQIFAPLIKLDKTGYIIASENCKTNIPGIYVAGDSRTKDLRQIVTATSDGAIAASQAANFINSNLL